MHIVIDARIRRASTGRYTDRLVQHLQAIDKENNYTILVEQDDQWEMTNPNFRTLPIKYQQFSFNPFDQMGFAWKLYRLKPDLVHFTMTQQPLLYFGNIVTTTHDLTMLKYTRPSRFNPLLHKFGIVMYRFLLWWAHRKSKKIIVPTDWVLQDVAKHHPFTQNKLVRTYESVDPLAPGKTQEPDYVSKPFIFHIGATLPHKNIPRLIKALEIIHTSQPELKLVLPGKMKPIFRQDLQDWIDSSPAGDSVVVPGFIPDEELRWLYENAECYALPALAEGFGLPGLEAMDNNCPLVSSNATCLPEVYGDAALYFDPYDPKDIADKITRVMSDKKLAKDLINEGRKQLKKYSWRKMATETLEVYKSTV